VHLCHPAFVGGLERVVQGIAPGVARSGHRVTVLSIVEPGQDVTAFHEPFEDTPVETVTLEVPGRRYLGERRLVRDVLRESAPDVVHSHGYRADVLHGPVARSLGIATVSTIHGSSRMGRAPALYRWVQRRSLRQLDAVVAVSSPLVSWLKECGVAPERIHVVPNAWTPPSVLASRSDARSALDVTGDALVLGWVGRLIPIKGCDVFIRALAETRTEGWTARVVGDGPDRPALEALAEDLGVADRVRFLGAIPDAARLAGGFDLFVLSSRSEGTPMALLEAMGAGVPAVAAAVGGVPDVVSDPSEGWLVPPVDPTALAAAIDQAVKDPRARQERGRRAEARVRADFDYETWIDRHDDVYQSAIRTRRGGA